jgi:hypothetical protein
VARFSALGVRTGKRAPRAYQVWLRELAEQAFAYEDWLFDPVHQNWPDLRYYHSWRWAR